MTLVDLDKLIGGLLDEIGKLSKSDAVVGKPIAAGDATVVPLCRVSIGFGTGGGRGAEGGWNGSGAGGALVVEPRAFVVVDPEGSPHMLALRKGGAVTVRRGVEVPRKLPGPAGGRNPDGG